MPVLTGLFLYLGTSALKGNQMWQRGVQLLSDPAMDPPNQAWTKAKVPRKVTAAFTLVQYAALATMIWIKGCVPPRIDMLRRGLARTGDTH